MPLLLRGFSLPDPTLRAGVIDTFLSAAQADIEAEAKTATEGSVVTEHASSLTSIMLQNSAASEMADTVGLASTFSRSCCHIENNKNNNRECGWAHSSIWLCCQKLCGIVCYTHRRQPSSASLRER